MAANKTPPTTPPSPAAKLAASAAARRKAPAKPATSPLGLVPIASPPPQKPRPAPSAPSVTAVDFDPSTKRFHSQPGHKMVKKGDIKQVSKDLLSTPHRDQLEGMGKFSETFKDDIKEHTDRIESGLDEEIDAISKAKVYVRDVGEHIKARLVEEATKTPKSKLLTVASHYSDEMAKEHIGPIGGTEAKSLLKENESARSDMLADMRQAVTPKWLTAGKSLMQKGKESKTFGISGMSTGMGKLLSGYEETRLKSSGYNDYAKAINEQFDDKAGAIKKNTKLTDTDKLLNVLKKIEKNTRGGHQNGLGGAGASGGYGTTTETTERAPARRLFSMNNMAIAGGIGGLLRASSGGENAKLMGPALASIAGGLFGRSYDRGEKTTTTRTFQAQGGDYGKRLKDATVADGSEQPKEKDSKGGLLSGLLSGLGGMFAKLGGIFSSLMKPIGMLLSKFLPILGKFASRIAGQAASMGGSAIQSLLPLLSSPPVLAAVAATAAIAAGAAGVGIINHKLTRQGYTEKEYDAHLASPLAAKNKTARINELMKEGKSPQEAANIANKEASEYVGKLEAAKKAKAETISSAEDKKKATETAKANEKHAQVIAPKTINVASSNTSSVAGGIRPRNSESSLEVYLKTRMLFA